MIETYVSWGSIYQMEHPATMPYKNPLTPRMFLDILIRVSQIWVVIEWAHFRSSWRVTRPSHGCVTSPRSLTLTDTGSIYTRRRISLASLLARLTRALRQSWRGSGRETGRMSSWDVMSCHYNHEIKPLRSSIDLIDAATTEKIYYLHRASSVV